MFIQSTFRIFLIVITTVATLYSNAQSFNNINARVDGGEIVITYDLVGSNTQDGYRVELRSSFDNFNAPLQSVSGDVGERVKPGNSLTVRWNPSSQLPEDFNEQIQFKLLGVPLSTEPVSTSNVKTFQFPTSGDKLKRGREVKLEWSGTGDENYSLQLYRFESKIQNITVVRSGSSYQWQIPADMEKGEGYELRLVNDLSPSNAIKSGGFTIVPKLPLGLKLAPLLVIGGVVAVMGGGESGSGGTTEDSTLPAPPDPN